MFKTEVVVLFLVAIAISPSTQIENRTRDCLERELEDDDIPEPARKQIEREISSEIDELVTTAPSGTTGDEIEFFDDDGFKTVPLTDDDVIKAAKSAARRVSSDAIFDNYFKVLAILYAKKKMVQKKNYFGKKEMEPVYKMTIAVQETDCKKREKSYSDIDSCNFVDSKYAYQLCNVVEYPEAPHGYIGTRGEQECHYTNKQRLHYIIEAIQKTDKVEYPNSDPDPVSR